MYRSHFRTLQRHYRLYGALRDRDEEDDEEPEAAGPSRLRESAASSNGEATNKATGTGQNPNDLWFKPVSAKGTKGKGQDTTEDDAIRSRYQRMYTVRISPALWRRCLIDRLPYSF